MPEGITYFLFHQEVVLHYHITGLEQAHKEAADRAIFFIADMNVFNQTAANLYEYENC